jgi:hypothetical protein
MKTSRWEGFPKLISALSQGKPKVQLGEQSKTEENKILILN